MNQQLTPLSKLLLLFNVIILLLIGVQSSLLALQFDDDSRASFADSTIADTQQLVQSLGALKLTEYDALIETPLFIEGRKALPRDEVDVDKSQKKANQAVKFTARLVGLSQSNAGSLALMLDNKNDYHRLLIGDELEGWMLELIGASHVVLSRNGEEKEIQLEQLIINKGQRGKDAKVVILNK
jgi:hypothetical protein